MTDELGSKTWLWLTRLRAAFDGLGDIVSSQSNPFFEHLESVNRKLIAAARVPAEYLVPEQRSRVLVVNKPRPGLDAWWLHRGRNINTLIANPWSRPRDRVAQITRSRGVVQWLLGGVPAQIGASG